MLRTSSFIIYGRTGSLTSMFASVTQTTTYTVQHTGRLMTFYQSTSLLFRILSAQVQPPSAGARSHLQRKHGYQFAWNPKEIPRPIFVQVVPDLSATSPHASLLSISILGAGTIPYPATFLDLIFDEDLEPLKHPIRIYYTLTTTGDGARENRSIRTITSSNAPSPRHGLDLSLHRRWRICLGNRFLIAATVTHPQSITSTVPPVVSWTSTVYNVVHRVVVVCIELYDGAPYSDYQTMRLQSRQVTAAIAEQTSRRRPDSPTFDCAGIFRIGLMMNMEERHLH
ncbi:hypothetical protein C8Q74DRAFT_1220348 [Fomes fomentarius]|nr:hypothetical protein C8Q74DRAFT_1220348 [Fomes fomentarius]